MSDNYTTIINEIKKTDFQKTDYNLIDEIIPFKNSKFVGIWQDNSEIQTKNIQTHNIEDLIDYINNLYIYYPEEEEKIKKQKRIILKQSNQQTNLNNFTIGNGTCMRSDVIATSYFSVSAVISSYIRAGNCIVLNEYKPDLFFDKYAIIVDNINKENGYPVIKVSLKDKNLFTENNLNNWYNINLFNQKYNKNGEYIKEYPFNIYKDNIYFDKYNTLYQANQNYTLQSEEDLYNKTYIKQIDNIAINDNILLGEVDKENNIINLTKQEDFKSFIFEEDFLIDGFELSFIPNDNINYLLPNEYYTVKIDNIEAPLYFTTNDKSIVNIDVLKKNKVAIIYYSKEKECFYLSNSKMDDFNKLYPIGTIIMFANNINNINNIPGEWEEKTKKFLLANNENGEEGENEERTSDLDIHYIYSYYAYIVGNTTKGHSLTLDELPTFYFDYHLNNHTHTYSGASKEENNESSEDGIGFSTGTSIGTDFLTPIVIGELGGDMPHYHTFTNKQITDNKTKKIAEYIDIEDIKKVDPYWYNYKIFSRVR